MNTPVAVWDIGAVVPTPRHPRCTPVRPSLADSFLKLVFQDAATVASEGLNVLPFGAYTAES